MMRNLENDLKNAKHAEPSSELDARIAALFSEAMPEREGLLAAPVLLWKTAAACAVSAVLGGLATMALNPGTTAAPPHQQVIYIQHPLPAGTVNRFDWSVSHDDEWLEGDLEVIVESGTPEREVIG